MRNISLCKMSDESLNFKELFMIIIIRSFILIEFLQMMMKDIIEEFKL